MAMSRGCRVCQWPHKSQQVSPCQSAPASGPMGKLPQVLEHKPLLGPSQPTQQLHAEPLLHHRVALHSDWGMVAHNGPGLLQSCKVLLLCPEMLAPVRIWRRKKTRFFIYFFKSQFSVRLIITEASTILLLLSFLDRNRQRGGHGIFPLITSHLGICH